MKYLKDSFLNPVLFISMFTHLQWPSSQPLLMYFCVSWHIASTFKNAFMEVMDFMVLM